MIFNHLCPATIGRRAIARYTVEYRADGRIFQEYYVSLDGQTQLVGVIGWPVAHSLLPAMHNAAFSYACLNWRYVPLPVRTEHLAVAIRGMAALGFRGANVTVPHKVDVIPLLDNITEAVT